MQAGVVHTHKHTHCCGLTVCTFDERGGQLIYRKARFWCFTASAQPWFDLEIRGVLNSFAWSQEREKKIKASTDIFNSSLFFSGKRGTTLGKRRKKMTSSTSTTLDSRSLELSLSYTHNATLDVLIAVTAEVINSFHFFSGQKGAWSTSLSALSILWHFPLCFSSICDLSREGENQFSIYDTEQRWKRKKNALKTLKLKLHFWQVGFL